MKVEHSECGRIAVRRIGSRTNLTSLTLPTAPMTAPTYTTSQLAEAAEVGNQTLRYYERRGLLPEPPRTVGGHRLYGPKHLERLQFIQTVQGLGFQLEEIQALLRVREEAVETPASHETIDHFLDRLDEKANALQDMRTSIAALRAEAETSLARD
jgi:MerR family mercuric resistance operon transcriptional regulator